MFPNTPEIRAVIRAALREDSSRNDVTTRLLIEPSWRLEAVIVAKANGVVCGLPLAAKIFKAVDPHIQIKSLVREGATVQPRSRLASIKGRARSVLSGERPALNALQHLSGIATFAHTQVKRIKGTGVKLYDTRKTLPGWRALQKYAVRTGGALNHRMSLGDAVMIKDNHLKVARLAKGDWLTRARKLRREYPRTLLQLEIQTEFDLQEALRFKPERVLLDNLPPRKLSRMMRTLRKSIPGIEIEITGGVRPENLRALANLGPDRISMGCLTHSVLAFDCSLDIQNVYS